MIDLKLQKTLQAAGTSQLLELDFTIEKGQFVTLFGESGAGKTSTLRLISGLLKPDSGHIIVDGEVWYDERTNLAPGKRKTGYVFQDYALFPNMTVHENIQFACSRREGTFVRELLETMDLEPFKDRKPTSLSGGQQQRVAVARALAVRPKLLLLDEPLSALDQQMRHRLQDYLFKIHQKYELTTILVSHDVAEIMKLSDWIIEIQAGKIIQKCTPSARFAAGMASTKFQFTGEIRSLQLQDVIVIITINIGNDQVKIVCDIEEAKNLAVGDKVVVGAKAFNPIIQKI